MNVQDGKLAGVKIIKPSVFEDERGFFMESYSLSKFQQAGISHTFVQDNHSLSAPVGVVRGLHYQLPPKAQTKLIRVTAGKIFDVVVDIRKDSPMFGQWEGFIISAENKLQILVPKGFAHGFCTLESHTEVQYKVDEYYSPEHDRGIIWNDPVIGIEWPVKEPILSAKDRKHPSLKAAEL